jgi:hypothetical protein
MKLQPRYQPGDKIGGRYQVHQALMGGTGEVYLCLDLETIQPFALKTFQQRFLGNPQQLRTAFEKEVSAWAALEKHPNRALSLRFEAGKRPGGSGPTGQDHRFWPGQDRPRGWVGNCGCGK